MVAKYQAKDTALKAKLCHRCGSHQKPFRGGGVVQDLICLHNKIALPKVLQMRTVQWYHDTLCHPGETRTEQTIRQHYWWCNLQEYVHQFCKTCAICQKTKLSKKKYGHLPEKRAEANPWDVLCVDLIGPYKITRKGKSDLKLHCVTMIDPVTGWFEMKQIPDKRANTIANIVEMTWFTRYPWPTQLCFDRGKEFRGEFAKMVENDYGVTWRPITTRNPQANAIIKSAPNLR